MNKKEILKKLKSENGLTGADIAVSISIIVITVVLVAMIYVNIDIANKSISRNAGATKLATNILENIELEDYENITQKNTQTDGSFIYNTRVPKGYNVTVNVEDSSTADILKIAKKVVVEVTYKVSGDEKKVRVSTVVEDEFSEECNAPNFSNNFLEQSSDSETKQLASKIFVPIKYSYITGSYVVTNESDDEWYNYSSKEWAKALVFDDELTKNSYIDENTGKIITETVDGLTYKNFMYVWIPNFGKTDNITLSDGSVLASNYFFRAGANATNDSKNGIRFIEAREEDGKILNAYKIDEQLIFKTSTSDAVIMNGEGYWRLYASSPSTSTVYGILNSSRFGPMIVY